MIFSIGIVIISVMNSRNFFSIAQHLSFPKKFLNYHDLLKQRIESLFSSLTLSMNVLLCSPLGRMLLSFLNKDPISVAQQTGNNNMNSPDSDMHIVSSNTNANTKLENIPARKCILPIIDKTKLQINTIEQIINRTLSTKEKDLLKDVYVLFEPNPSYSPMLTQEHLILLSNSTTILIEIVNLIYIFSSFING